MPWLIDRLKYLCAHQPPLVTFMATLLLIGCGLIIYGFYITSHSLSDPAVQDWNDFLERFDRLELCFDASTLSEQDLNHPVDASDDVEMYSVELTVKVSNTSASFAPVNVTTLSFLLDPNQLDIAGDNSSTGQIYGVVHLNLADELSECRKSSKSHTCPSLSVRTCVDLYAQPDLFPDQRRGKLQQCVLNETSADVVLSDGGGGVTPAGPGSRLRLVSLDECDPSTRLAKITFSHKFDLALMAMLSIGDKSLINLHLFHTSYFLFVMVIMLLVFSMMRGRQGAATPAGLSTHRDSGKKYQQNGFRTLVNEDW